jgi:hypothetical protein
MCGVGGVQASISRFQLEDKLLFQGGRDVMYSKKYGRCPGRQES